MCDESLITVDGAVLVRKCNEGLAGTSNHNDGFLIVPLGAVKKLRILFCRWVLSFIAFYHG